MEVPDLTRYADWATKNFTNPTGKFDTQKIVDFFLSTGSGSFKGPDTASTLALNGYAQSMIPSAAIGAGTGALLNALRGKSILSGAGIGLGLGAGAGALHQYLYDTNRDYAFKNPFTKFVEWMTLPKYKDGTIYAYDYIRNMFPEVHNQLAYDTSLEPWARLLTHKGSTPLDAYAENKLTFKYKDLRDYIANTKDKDLVPALAKYLQMRRGAPQALSIGFGVPIPNIPIDKIRPHHLYTPLAGLHYANNQINKQQ